MGLLDSLLGKNKQEVKREKMADVIQCPYCMKEIKPDDILFMLDNEQGAVDEKFIETASRYQGFDAANSAQAHTGTIISQHDDDLKVEIEYGEDSQFPEVLRWQRNGGETRAATTRICPHCHCYIPPDIERMDAKTIVLLGSTSSGKTTLIAGMLYMLVGDLREKRPTAMISSGLGSVRIERDSLYFAKRIMMNSLINAERDATEREKPIFPIVMVVQNSANTKRTLVTIHDFAGEALDDTTYFAEHPIADNLHSTDGILYAIDCCQLSSIKDYPVAHSCTDSVIAAFAKFTGRMKNVLKKADAVAVTLTKFDVYMKYKGTQANKHAFVPLLTAHDEGVDINTIKDVSQTVKSIVDEDDTNIHVNFVNTFNRKLKGTSALESMEYFATACLKSKEATDQEMNSEVTCSFDATCLHRVCEPLLYMFKRWDIIK